jgi:hypothetical protein
MPAARMSPPGRQDALRRVDWRFLLPETALATVVVVGPVDAALLAGLEHVAGRVIQLDAESADASSATLVVTIAANKARLRQALRCLPPGAFLYAGAGLPGTAGRSSLREATAAIRSAGVVDLRRAWHWPSEPAALEIIPLDDSRAVGLALDRRRSGRIARLKAALAGLALRVHLFERIVPGWSVIARRPSTAAASDPAAALDPVLASLPDIRAGDTGIILLTPRFRASRHVVGLVARADGDRLAAVAKLPRVRSDTDGIRREAAALARAAELRVSGVPEVLAFRVEPAPALVESALDGVVIGSREVRARPDAVLAEVEAWTRTLVGPSSAPRVPLRTLWGPSLDRLAAALDRSTSDEAVDGRPPGIAGLVQRTAQILGAVPDVAVRAVLEHGDLAPPNLLRLRDGRLGVVDWEVADPEGLPLGDLLFFAAFVAFAASVGRRAADPAATPVPDSAALRIIERQAAHLDIAPGLIPVLTLAMWARWADRQSARFTDSTTTVDERLPARHLHSWAAAIDGLEAAG